MHTLKACNCSVTFGQLGYHNWAAFCTFSDVFLHDFFSLFVFVCYCYRFTPFGTQCFATQLDCSCCYNNNKIPQTFVSPL